MSNNYVPDLSALQPGEVARSADINDRYNNTVAGFDILPTPFVGDKGFVEAIQVGAATVGGHAVNRDYADARYANITGDTFTGSVTIPDLTISTTATFLGATIADLGTVTTANIDGGTLDGMTINNSVIGGTTPAAGTFTSLTATTADINGGTIDGAAINGTTIGATTAAAGTFSSLTATTADINGGTVDSATIGATTPSTGTFTSLATNTITERTAASGVTIDSVLLKDNVVKATDIETSTVSANDGTLALTITNATGNVDVDTSLSVDTINESTTNAGVTIDSVLLKDDVVNATDIEVSTISANDGTLAINISNTSGAVDIDTSLNVDGLTTTDGLVSSVASEIFSNAFSGGETPALRLTNTSEGVGTTSTLELIAGSTNSANNTRKAVIENTSTTGSGSTLNFYTTPDGTNLYRRMYLQNNGDVSFYDTTGAVEGFHWDAADNRLGIGTATPTGKISIEIDDATLYSSSNMFSGTIAQYIFNTSATDGTHSVLGFGVDGTSTDAQAAMGAVYTGTGQGALVFGTRNGGNVTERVRITNTGELQAKADLVVTGDTASDTWTQGANYARPSVRPSLLLDFANSKTVDSRVTWKRDSTATYYDGTRVSADKNLVVHSEDFSQPYYVKIGGLTVVANDTTAPDGSATADRINAFGAISYLAVSVGWDLGRTITRSVYAKAGTTNFMWMECYDSANRIAYFDLGTGTTGGVSGVTAEIEDVGSGWYRCSIVYAATGSANWNFGPAASVGTRAVSGNIYVWGAQAEYADSATTYTPTTYARYVSVLRSAGIDEARIDHDPFTGECLGLLVEEPRTNLALYSEDMSNAVYQKSNVVVESNAAIAPDGTLSADLVRDNTATNQHLFYQNVTVADSTNHAFSVYLKDAGWGQATLQLGNSGVTGVFNFSTGAIGGSAAYKAMEDIGGGWYRCIIMDDTNTSDAMYIYKTSSSYTGDNYSGVYVWGFQVEATGIGEFPTSYIPTGGSTAARATETGFMTDLSWYNYEAGTLYGEGSTVNAAGSARIVSIGDGTYNNRIAIALRNPDHQFILVSDNTTYLSALDYGDITDNQTSKFAVAFARNDAAGSIDGGAVVTTTTAELPRVATIAYIGSNEDGTAANSERAYIRKIAYYPKRLTNAELQGVTQE